MNCVNCGKETEQEALCDQCLKVSAAIEKALSSGVVLEYKNGMKEVIKTKEKSK